MFSLCQVSHFMLCMYCHLIFLVVLLSSFSRWSNQGLQGGWVGSHTPAAHSGAFLFFFPQKDLLLSEIPSSTTSLCSGKMEVEKVMAKEICQKYLEKRAGRLPEDCAEALAMASCLCLRRRNASLVEVSLSAFPLQWALSRVSWGSIPRAAWVCFTRDRFKTWDQSCHRDVISNKPRMYLFSSSRMYWSLYQQNSKIWIRVSQEPEDSVLLASGV